MLGERVSSGLKIIRSSEHRLARNLFAKRA
jgi:hypothetical protein